MQDEIRQRLNAFDIEGVDLLLRNIDCPINSGTKNRIKSKVFNKAGIKKPRRRIQMNKLLLSAAIAALIICVGAAHYNGISELLAKYFGDRLGRPLATEELYQLINAGQMLQIQASGEGYTVELSALVGDEIQMYGFVRVTADDGSPMNKNYDFKRCHVYLPEDREDIIYGRGRKGQFLMPEMLGEGCFMVHFEPVLDVLGEKTNLMGKEISINFRDLVECDEFGRPIKNISYNDWELTFTLNKGMSTTDYLFNDLTITNEGCIFDIQALRLSSLALYIDGVLEMPYIGITQDASNAPFPVEIILKDGTVMNEFYQDGSRSTGTFTGNTWSYEIVRSIIFRKPIDPDTVSAVKINGVDITLTN